MKTGTLYIIPSDFGEDSLILLPSCAIDIIHGLNHFVVENEKTARSYLKRIHYPKPLNGLVLFALNNHTPKDEVRKFIEPLLKGIDVGVLSEAGCPGIADPGADVVKIAHSMSIAIKPLTGPSSILLALMASGFSGQNFVFHGYLPKEKNERLKKIQRMESDSGNRNQTQLFIETPYHNNNLLKELTDICSKNTMLCIATDITLPNEFIKSMSIGDWKKNLPDLNKRPTVFLIYAGQ